MIKIHNCKEDDINDVMDFINEHWKKGHVLSTHKNLFEWQYKSEKNEINLLIAKESDEILGILGYIKNSNYDINLYKNDVIWLALWKVKNDAPSGLGLKLYEKLKRQEPGSIIAVNGINKLHPPIYRALGFENIKFNCFYMTNPKINQSIIKHNIPLPIASPSFHANLSLEEIGISEIKKIDFLPIDSANLNRKSLPYFTKRYLLHPFYDYRIFSIIENKDCLGLISSRIVSYKNYRALRILDFVGDPFSLSKVGNEILDLIIKEEIEYVDFWQYGLDDTVLIEGGFSKLDTESEDIIIPNFFEPLVQEKTNIYSAVKYKDNRKFLFCRADGDQDRPNQL